MPQKGHINPPHFSTHLRRPLPPHLAQALAAARMPQSLMSRCCAAAVAQNIAELIGVGLSSTDEAMEALLPFTTNIIKVLDSYRQRCGGCRTSGGGGGKSEGEMGTVHFRKDMYRVSVRLPRRTSLLSQGLPACFLCHARIHTQPVEVCVFLDA